MDGTITQTNQLIFDSFNFIAERYLKKKLTPTEIVSLFGPPESGALQTMLGYENIEVILEEYHKFYEEKHNELATLYPGIREILKFIKDKGIIVALFTGKGRLSTDITLREFGIEKYFEMVVTGDDVKKYKPSGNGIQKILDKFSLNPSNVLMVGDAVSDILAARETGVRVASVVWDSYGKDKVLLMEPDHLFHSVVEFEKWIQQNI